MTRLDDVRQWIEQRLPALLEEHDVPAAGWAVLRDGQAVDGAAGVLNRGTGVEATADSLFQIGSITKLWTASLVMQLVDEGLVDLDAPVKGYLPDFEIGDQEAARTITVRQLLTHTSGFEGDIFTDTGVGDDAIEKYLGTLHEVPQLFAPGEQFSYNNAAYCVLGRLVEVVRGTTYDAALRERLATPLGLEHVGCNPYESILFRVAAGHIEHEPGAGYVPAPIWAMARSNAPAGSMLAMSPRDLLSFAQLHLSDGQAQDGTRLLAPGTSARMQERAVGLPDIGVMGTSWGLGFERFDTADGDIVGHDGNTIGQAAFLRMVPAAGVAVVLLTNGGNAFAVYQEVVGHVLRELAGVTLPVLPTPEAEPAPVDAARVVGTYSADVADLVVSQDDDGRIWLQTVLKGSAAELGDHSSRKEMVGHGVDMLIPLQPENGLHVPHAFLGDDGEGHALYLHVGRAVRRAGA